MSDLLLTLSNDNRSARLVRAMGLPTPVVLARAQGPTTARELHGKIALVLSAPAGYASEALTQALQSAGATTLRALDEVDASQLLDIAVMDASGCQHVNDLRALFEGFHPLMRRLRKNARILLLANRPDVLADPVASACARSVEGFMRSLGKEVGKRGITANLVYVAASALSGLPGPVRFFCSARSTYVSGQAVLVQAPNETAGASVASAAALPMAGKVAVVTGCARGIGHAIATRLAVDGAHVVCIDIGAARDALYETALQLGGTALVLDISEESAGQTLADFVTDRWGGVDIVVHNAGITRDKTLTNMTEVQWDLVMAINFAAIARIDETLMAHKQLRTGGRLVCLSSISGIAGNFGQTNYATSKAALIGYVHALAKVVAQHNITVNAVAPGFIETPMTQKVPLFMREAGRRLNSLSQGGLPQDVAELVCFLASEDAAGINGNTVRVCGQALLGA